MPLFEYVCKKCGKEFEKLIFSIDGEQIECPSCKSADIEKKFSVFSSKSSKNDSCGCDSSSDCAVKKHGGGCGCGGGCCGI